MVDHLSFPCLVIVELRFWGFFGKFLTWEIPVNFKGKR